MAWANIARYISHCEDLSTAIYTWICIRHDGSVWLSITDRICVSSCLIVSGCTPSFIPLYQKGDNYVTIDIINNPQKIEKMSVLCLKL